MASVSRIREHTGGFNRERSVQDRRRVEGCLRSSSICTVRGPAFCAIWPFVSEVAEFRGDDPGRNERNYGFIVDSHKELL